MNLLHANDRLGEYPGSYYAATAAPLAPFAPLTGAARADICIIGGGYTGLSAALHLAERGLSVILLEAHRVGFGASGRNGGQVGTGQRLDQQTLEDMLGPHLARQLWSLGEEAKALVQDLITRHAMPVTFHPGIAHACRTQAEVRDYHQNAEKLARDYGYAQITPLDAAGLARLIGSKTYVGGDIDRGAGHLHPLNYAIGLAQAAARAGAVLHERSEVLRIEHGPKVNVHTAQGQVTVDQLILACNGYLGNLDGAVATKVMPINSYIIATEPLGARATEIIAEPVAVTDTKFVNNYWRLSEDGRLLFGGAETYGYRFTDVEKAVTKPMLRVYPQLAGTKIDYAWGGTLAITVNRLPCFTRPHPNVLSASGYSGYGVAMAGMAGKVLAEAVAGQAGRFDLLASLPQRRFPGGAALRSPLLVLAMTWYAMRDRLSL
ncbi:FAD-binding oxidoreductase [Tabrizicola sp.]|uniref:NAD(P)/FAD-dependent oxidoreductase n=1 Tax=Tabrizicola sp. TaxID=2005166 RepID=UPI00286C0C09|nr:FAD-binding oxidoreductase [Tabrizicola sp.]